MTKCLVVLAVSFSLASGCAHGRTAQKKQDAYVLSSVGIVAGAVLLVAAASPSSGSSSCADVNEPIACGLGSGIGGGLVRIGLAMLGTPLVVGGTVGVIVTAATPTTPEPLAPASARSRNPATVTAPGLKPASLMLP